MWNDKEYRWSVDDAFVCKNFVDEASNPTLELYAAWRFLERVLEEMPGDKWPGKITLYADYKEVVNYGQGRYTARPDGSHFQREAVNLVRVTQEVRKQTNLQFCYVPSHSGVYGNEEADDLAKCNLCQDELKKLKEI